MDSRIRTAGIRKAKAKKKKLHPAKPRSAEAGSSASSQPVIHDPTKDADDDSSGLSDPPTDLDEPMTGSDQGGPGKNKKRPRGGSDMDKMDIDDDGNTPGTPPGPRDNPFGAGNDSDEKAGNIQGPIDWEMINRIVTEHMLAEQKLAEQESATTPGTPPGPQDHPFGSGDNDGAENRQMNIGDNDNTPGTPPGPQDHPFGSGDNDGAENRQMNIGDNDNTPGIPPGPQKLPPGSGKNDVAENPQTNVSGNDNNRSMPPGPQDLPLGSGKNDVAENPQTNLGDNDNSRSIPPGPHNHPLGSSDDSHAKVPEDPTPVVAGFTAAQSKAIDDFVKDRTKACEQLLFEKIEAYEKLMDEKNKAYDELMDEKNKAYDELQTTAENCIDSYQKKRELDEEYIGSLKTELENLKTELEKTQKSVEENISRLQKAVDDLKIEKETLLAHNESLREMIAAQESTISDDKRVMTAQSRKIKDWERDYGRAQDRVQELTKETEGHKAASAAVGTRLGLVQKELADTKLELREANAELDIASRKVEKFERENADTPTVKELQKRIAAYEKRIEDLIPFEEELAGRDSLINTLRDQIAGLENDLEISREKEERDPPLTDEQKRAKRRRENRRKALHARGWYTDSLNASTDSDDGDKDDVEEEGVKKVEAPETLFGRRRNRKHTLEWSIDDFLTASRNLSPHLSHRASPTDPKDPGVASLPAKGEQGLPSPTDNEEQGLPGLPLSTDDEAQILAGAYASTGTQTGPPGEPQTPAPPHPSEAGTQTDGAREPPAGPSDPAESPDESPEEPAAGPSGTPDAPGGVTESPTIDVGVQTGPTNQPAPEVITIFKTAYKPKLVPIWPLIFCCLLALVTMLYASYAALSAKKERSMWLKANEMSRLTVISLRATGMRKGDGLAGGLLRWLLGDPTKGMEGGMWG
ncbi:hypothetical protein MMC08_003062 [Hypocenomyce scalaris]|nr:hypothetical protein [Hypocenomyce scalaris]